MSDYQIAILLTVVWLPPIACAVVLSIYVRKCFRRVEDQLDWLEYALLFDDGEPPPPGDEADDTEAETTNVVSLRRSA